MQPSPLRGNLRIRLTLWYGTAFAMLLLLYIAVATVVHYRQLYDTEYHAAIEDINTAEGLLYETPDGRLDMNESYYNNPQMRLRLDRMLEVIDPDGKVLYQNSQLQGATIGGAPLPDEGKASYNMRTLRLSDGRRVLAVSHFHVIHGRPIILRLAYAEAPLVANLARFVTVLVFLAPVSILLGAFVVYRVTSRALSPLSKMVRRAKQITAERLNERLPVYDPSDDLGHAALVFNELLQRLEDSFAQLKRFTADASHELRTPLASLRSIGEVSLQSSHTSQEYREVIASMLEEVSRLNHLVDSLLMISRSDSGQITMRLSTFSCKDLIQEVVELVGILAEEKGQRISVRGDATVTVRADRSILRQAVLNLVDNAIKYSPCESEIAVEVQRTPKSEAKITITDQGPGIPEEAKSLVFDRFYRTDEGRSRENGGAGLGLSIAKWAVETHEGTIGVRAGNGGGSCFYLTIPAQPVTELKEV